jgi:hypothetical protein
MNMEKELKEILEAFKWTFDNMGTPHTSDHFNIPANGIKMLEDLIEKKYGKCTCGYETEVGRIWCSCNKFK